MYKVLFGILVVVLVLGLILGGCSSQTSSPTTSAAATSSAATSSAATSAPTSEAAQPTQSTAASPAAAKTLKIGIAFYLSSSVGLDALHGIQLLAEEDNKNGGIDIGGEKYNIELISYDTEGNQTTEVAAINRLVFQDKVNYILTVGQFQSAWLKTTEENKVIVMSQDLVAPVDLAPSTYYSFNPTFQNPEITSKTGWFCKTYPDKVKNLVAVYIDNQFGHMIEGMNSPILKAFGATATNIYIPAQQVDLSAVATKIVSLNPTAVQCMTADSNSDALALNAVYQAGYHGQFFLASNNALATWLQFVSADALEGFITGMNVTEPDPALTTTAQHFKELWIAKYGSWTAPTTISTGLYPPLIAALKKAGSLDTTKVSDALASGLEFSSPTGDGKMISRPDLGNNRTVDSISTYYMKQIVNGKIKLLATISPDEALALFQTANPPKAVATGAPPAASAPAAGGAPTVITFDKAADYQDKDVTVSVTAEVADAITSPVTIAFLGGGMGVGLGVNIQDSSVDVAALKGKTITVTGKVTTSMMGGPEIVVSSASQITVK